MEDPHRKRSGDQLHDPSTVDHQAQEGAEAASPPAKGNDGVYMPIEGVSFEVVEELEMYRENGFHPVHLGDKLQNDDLEVVAKLGHGGYGTVWLCQEGHELVGYTHWRAVKIIAASQSGPPGPGNPELRVKDMLRKEGVTRAQWEAAGIMLPTRYFFLSGPNGKHLCLVFPVMGPNLMSQMEASPETIKNLLMQAGNSLRFLHKHGICHGDFTSANILLHIADVEKLSRNEMITLLEAPTTHEVKMADGSEPLGDAAPRYLVERSDINILGPKSQTATIDFGLSYNTGDPPAFAGIPWQYAAPEAFFQIGNTGETSDVWAFICMMMEIRCRGAFINTSQRKNYVQDLEVLLGPLPEAYRLAWKEELEAEGVVDDEVHRLSQPLTWKEGQVEEKKQEMVERSGYADYLQGIIGADREYVKYQRDENYTASPKKVTWRVPEKEVFQLADLFEKVLKYDPEKRIKMKEVLQHEWFKVGEAGEAKDGEKPTKRTPATRTSYDDETKGETDVPKTEEKRVATARPVNPAEAEKSGTVDEVSFKSRVRPSRIPIATKEPLGIGREGARIYDDQQWQDRDFGEPRKRRYHPQAVAQHIK
ncbi:hypothetical protein PG996_013005 [Apiospora saccharicola]|uniref:EKC/KEOPS complex subunit BUD32 n=1 Tax=Apiospora saccharicola TaxID=335842 RepID=A0ABR1U732_9PEZI